jgi:ATP dependent DNA ligase domain
MPAVMLWRVSRPLRSRSKPPGFILPCQPALADRPPSGPGWLHEIKFDGYRVIARKDGEQVRLWARTTSDYSKAFTRIRDAVAALPVESAVLDGEAIVLRPDNTSDFEALRSRQGQAEAILVAYDIMQRTGGTCALNLWKSAGSVWRSCYRVVTRRCAMASNLVKRSPATARRSSVTRAGWFSKGSSRSALVRGTSAAGRVLG